MSEQGGVRAWRAACAMGLCLAAAPLGAQQVVLPAGAHWKLGQGAVDAGGGDVRIGGDMQVQQGLLQGLRHLDIQAGGSLAGGDGAIRLSGDWRNAGSFDAGSSAVDFVDAPGQTSAQLSGNTSFFDLSFLSAAGKHYVFAVGSVQTVAGLLGIHGTAGLPIQFQSSAAGQVAELKLLPGGTQDIAHVGVSDVYATGQALAPALHNEGGSGNALGWFGSVQAPPEPVPTLSPIALLILLATLALAAARTPSLRSASVRGRS